MPTSEARSINADPPARESVRAFLRAAAISFRAEPRRVALLVIFQLLKDATALATVATVGAFVDGVARGALGSGVVIRLLILGAISQGAGWSAFGLGQAIRERVAHRFEAEVLDTVAAIPTIEHHERADFQNEVTLLRYQSVWLGGVANRLVDALSAAFRVVGTLALLAAVHPLLLLLALAALPAAAAARLQQRIHQRVTESTVERRRLAEVFVEAATTSTLAKEVRVFGLRGEIERRQAALQSEIDAEMNSADTKGTQLELGVRMFFGVGFGVAIIAVAVLAAHGRATLGDLVVTVGLAAQLTGHLSAASSAVGPLRDAAVAAYRFGWLERYAAAVQARVVPQSPVAVPRRLRDGIGLEGVGFTYPDTNRRVLHDVTFDLPAGATVAVVGENGAGKTTLVKLLTAMYEPTAGRIIVDGVDLAAFDPTQWRQAASAAFQDHARFEFILRESVGVGHVANVDDDRALVDALGRATADDVLGDLDAGLETQLGRMFEGGVDLSIGQWQKVALARGLMRSDPLLLVLDEPTSALDPRAERRLFDGFAAAARATAATTGGVTLLVSHRFSTVRTADLDVVLTRGSVEEMGTHDELMTRRGTYRELYDLQARGYR